jgi:hypothetical protein
MLKTILRSVFCWYARCNSHRKRRPELSTALPAPTGCDFFTISARVLP